MKYIFVIFAVCFWALSSSLGQQNNDPEKTSTTNDPAKSQAAFIISVSDKGEVKIEQKLRDKGNIQWDLIEKKIAKLSNTFREFLNVKPKGKGKRILVCIYVEEVYGVPIETWGDYYIEGNSVLIPSGKWVPVPMLFPDQKMGQPPFQPSK